MACEQLTLSMLNIANCTVVMYNVCMEDCHIFAGSLHSCGYGVVSLYINGKWRSRVIHRLIYESVYGEIPKGYVCDHICRNRLCINIEHLQMVTNEENLMLAHTRANRTHCSKGHEWTEDNTMYQLSRGQRYRRCKSCRYKWFKSI